MKTSVKTITHYETIRPPKRSALQRLAVVARDAGEEQLAQLFDRRAFAEDESLAKASIRETTRDTLNSLYVNLGDRCLLDQIRQFVRAARQGAAIRHPVIVRGHAETLDRDSQLSIWEKHLMRKRLRAGISAVVALETFAREYGEDMGATEDDALTYIRSFWG